MKISRKTIENILIFGFILSLISIVCIKFEVVSISANLSPRTISNINDVLLNLSYGYFVSFITYYLTVLIPEKQRQRKASFLLINDINNYQNCLITTILSLREIFGIYDFDKNKYVKDYIKEHDLIFKAIESQIKSNKESFIISRINSLNNKYSTLTNKFIILEKSIPDDIYDSFLSILNGEIGIFISFLNEDPTLNSLKIKFNNDCINIFNDHIKAIGEIRDSLKKEREQ